MTFSSSLQAAFRQAESICVLTGAGISAESGVPTFRGEQGLWKKFKPEELASFDAFIQNPDLVWEWYSYRRKVMEEVRPNPGHFALADMQTCVRDFTLVTQNVDNLHIRAGSRNVLELHGNITRSYCSHCRKPADERVLESFDRVPHCESCGGLVRPDVVWFGELLPASVFEEAFEAARRADLFLLVGTSGVVYPAASIPLLAREHGAYVVEINPEYTDLSTRVSETILGPSGSVLPAMMGLLKGYRNYESA